MKAVCLLVLAACLCASVDAATRTAVMSGVWTNTAVWGGASAPVAGDSVIIPTGFVVNLPAAVTPIALAGLNLGNGVAGNGLTGIECDTFQAEVSVSGAFVASATNVQQGNAGGKSWYVPSLPPTQHAARSSQHVGSAKSQVTRSPHLTSPRFAVTVVASLLRSNINVIGSGTTDISSPTYWTAGRLLLCNGIAASVTINPVTTFKSYTNGGSDFGFIHFGSTLTIANKVESGTNNRFVLIACDGSAHAPIYSGEFTTPVGGLALIGGPAGSTAAGALSFAGKIVGSGSVTFRGRLTVQSSVAYGSSQYSQTAAYDVEANAAVNFDALNGAISMPRE